MSEKEQNKHRCFTTPEDYIALSRSLTPEEREKSLKRLTLNSRNLTLEEQLAAAEHRKELSYDIDYASRTAEYFITERDLFFPAINPANMPYIDACDDGFNPLDINKMKLRVNGDILLENALNCLSLFDVTKLTIPDVKQAISWLEDWIDARESADCKIKFPAYEIEETETECEACKIQFPAENEGYTIAGDHDRAYIVVSVDGQEFLAPYNINSLLTQGQKAQYEKEIREYIESIRNRKSEGTENG